MPTSVAQHEDDFATHLIHFQRALDIICGKTAQDLLFDDVECRLPVTVKQRHSRPASDRFRLVNGHGRQKARRDVPILLSFLRFRPEMRQAHPRDMLNLAYRPSCRSVDTDND